MLVSNDIIRINTSDDYDILDSSCFSGVKFAYLQYVVEMKGLIFKRYHAI